MVAQPWRLECPCGFETSCVDERAAERADIFEHRCAGRGRMTKIDAAWAQLDAEVDEIYKLMAEVARNAETMPASAPGAAATRRILEVAQARSKGKAEILALLLDTTVQAVSAEAARRYQGRKGAS